MLVHHPLTILQCVARNASHMGVFLGMGNGVVLFSVRMEMQPLNPPPPHQSSLCHPFHRHQGHFLMVQHVKICVSYAMRDQKIVFLFHVGTYVPA